MTFTEEQIYIIETIVNNRIKEHDKTRAITRKDLMVKLNSLKEGEDENVAKYILAVKNKISYDTTNEELKLMIDGLRDIIRSYKLLGKQMSLEKKYALLLRCEVDDLKGKIDINWNASSDDEIKENINTLKKLIIDFPLKKSWWRLW
jgi:hypothetical protein